MHSSKDSAVLLGLDIGSTTTALLISESKLATNWVTRRKEFAEHRVRFSPPAVFTPYSGNRIAIVPLQAAINRWLGDAEVSPKEIHCCGGILTGLAAKTENAREVEDLLRSTFGHSVLVAAQDPRLESWVAFMGASRELSREHSGSLVLNIDIGGGTSNVAWGKNGEVFSTGSYFVGARPFTCIPGSFRLKSISSVGDLLFTTLGISKRVGEELSDFEVNRLVEHHVQILERVIQGDRVDAFLQAEPKRSLVPDYVTLSGGVGELTYAMLQGQNPAPALFGDLGVELARALLRSKTLRPFLEKAVPKERGRATVYGLTIHNVLVSGTTCFVRPEQLPLGDLPLVGKTCDEQELVQALSAALEFPKGGALFLPLKDTSAIEVRRVGTFIARYLQTLAPQKEKALVLLVKEDVGKSLGNYASAWGGLPHQIIVIDGVHSLDAQMISLGHPVGGVVPVSFFGML